MQKKNLCVHYTNKLRLLAANEHNIDGVKTWAQGTSQNSIFARRPKVLRIRIPVYDK